MTFPLLPILQAVPGAAPDNAPETEAIADNVTFDLMFDLGKKEVPPAKAETLIANEVPEIVEEHDETTDDDVEPDKSLKADTETMPVQTPVPEKPQKTFLETAFATIAQETKPKAEQPPKDQFVQHTNQVTRRPIEGTTTDQPLGLTAERKPPLAKAVARDVDQSTQQLAQAPLKTMTIDSRLPVEPSPAKLPEPNFAPRMTQPAEVRRVDDKHPRAIETGQQPSRQPLVAAPVQAASIGQNTMPPAIQRNPVEPHDRKIEAPGQTIQPQVNAKIAAEPATSAPITPAIGPVITAATPPEAELSKPSFEVPFVHGVGDIPTSPSRTSTPETTQMPAPTPQLAKAVSHQMAVAVSQTAGGSTEIVLSPEELGKVRMVMSVQETGITVLIQAERPETNDMLRRHIETLSQEFKNLGYSTTSFTFAQDQQEQSEQRSESNEPWTTAVEDNPEVMQPLSIGSSTGLDLRI